jgi:hypothetical protein
LQNLESRIITLEESLRTIRAHISDLSHQFHFRVAVNNGPDAPPEPVQVESSANIEEIEDSVDAMGTVVFADEEDCGFFGRVGFFIAERRNFDACNVEDLN